MMDKFDPEHPPQVPEGISRSTMKELPFSLVITDPSLEDHPIIYVNRAFVKTTGYDASVAVGRNCRFLQGENTSEADVQRIRDAIAAEQEVTIDIVNYRANEERFVNRLMIAPLKNDEGKTTHFLGIQTERPEGASVADRAMKLDESLREIQHRVKNHLAMLLALIRLEAKRSGTSQSTFDVLANRVEALSLLYHEFANVAGDSGEVRLGAYISRVCSALNMLDGQNDVIVNIDAEALQSKVEPASHMGLLVSELLTNSLQHAFPDGHTGKVEVRLWENEDDGICLQVIDDGVGLPEGCEWPQKGNLGSRIVRDLAARLDADLSVDTGAKGTKVKLEIPQASLR